MCQLIVIVDPDWGDRLAKTARDRPVWVVASPSNSNAARDLLGAAPITDHREPGSITTFRVTDPGTRIANLADLVPTIEDHYGAVRDGRMVLPVGFAVRVVGLEPSPAALDAMRAKGFCSFSACEDGFLAWI